MDGKMDGKMDGWTERAPPQTRGSAGTHRAACYRLWGKFSGKDHARRYSDRRAERDTPVRRSQSTSRAIAPRTGRAPQPFRFCGVTPPPGRPSPTQKIPASRQRGSSSSPEASRISLPTSAARPGASARELIRRSATMTPEFRRHHCWASRLLTRSSRSTRIPMGRLPERRPAIAPPPTPHHGNRSVKRQRTPHNISMRLHMARSGPFQPAALRSTRSDGYSSRRNPDRPSQGPAQEAPRLQAGEECAAAKRPG